MKERNNKHFYFHAGLHLQMMKTLYKACQGYAQWKQEHGPGYKPWLYPEQMETPKLIIEQVRIFCYCRYLVKSSPYMFLFLHEQPLTSSPTSSTDKCNWKDEKEGKVILKAKS